MARRRSLHKNSTLPSSPQPIMVEVRMGSNPMSHREDLAMKSDV